MAITASRLFAFLECPREYLIERYEVTSSAFSRLRRSLRFIVTQLLDIDDPEAQDVSDDLRALLSKLLTSPTPFDSHVLEVVQSLGDPRVVENRWGQDIRVSYDDAASAAQELQQGENPARSELRALIQKCQVEERLFKIYCHRQSYPHFASLVHHANGPVLGPDSFLHSVRDYACAHPFDVLIKMGPLRSRGWGSAPDALVSAPRFATLMQVVWSGCTDEPAFGYDPISSAGPVASPSRAMPGGNAVRGGDAMSWTLRAGRISTPEVAAEPAEPDLDELQMFHQLGIARDGRHATLLQIDPENGILYPPHSLILSFDPGPGAKDPMGRRPAGDTLLEGMFVIRPVLAEPDLGGVKAEHGFFSRIWKARLNEARAQNVEALCKHLLEGGLDLVRLHSAVDHWCKPPSTVIHAPQQQRHFEILIRLLGCDFTDHSERQRRRHPWWRYAWEEIRRSRGEAIQAGVLEHEIVDERLLGLLNGILPGIQAGAATADVFTMDIPGSEGLEGMIFFNKILAIEEGFVAPEPALRLVHDLDTIARWRV